MGLPISPKEIADIAAWSEGKSSIGEWPVEKLLSHIAAIEAKLAEVQHFLADEKAVRRNAEAQLASAHDTLDYFGHSPPYDGSQAKANKVRIAALETKCRELEAALKQSMTCIDDWLNIYASEMCDEKRVVEALERVGERGTLAYIAGVQEINRRALKPTASETSCEQVGDVIHCTCGKPASHYGTMGESGAREVRETTALNRSVK